jgi:hypothetical protein
MIEERSAIAESFNFLNIPRLMLKLQQHEYEDYAVKKLQITCICRRECAPCPPNDANRANTAAATLTVSSVAIASAASAAKSSTAAA